MSDPIKHECGIAHIRLRKPLQFYIDKYNTPLYGANKLLLLMKKMQNRGQDGAGIANIKIGLEPGYRYISRYRSIDPEPLNKIFEKVGKKFGKAQKESTKEQFHSEDYLKRNYGFTGEIWLGHLRYGTHGKNGLESCHPFLRQNNWRSRNLVVAGNFNMTNVDELFDILVNLGQNPKEKTDTVTVMEKIGHFLDEENQLLFDEFKDQYNNLEITAKIEEELSVLNILKKSFKDFDGGYAMVGLMGHGASFVARDPAGIRPAYYYADEEIIMVASEKPAIKTAINCNYNDIKEVLPGHALIIDKDGGLTEEQFVDKLLPKKSCTFERIYFSRSSDPDIYRERKKLGELLVPKVLQAVNFDLKNTIFSYIPNSAETAFLGLMSGIDEYLIKKRKEIIIDGKPSPDDLDQVLSFKPRVEKLVIKDAKLRTFITGDAERDELVANVYDTTYEVVNKGKDNLVVIDDSIVRGTTLEKSILTLLDKLDPKKVVIVSSAPQIRYPDCYGIDMSRMKDFVAFRAVLGLLEDTGRSHLLDEVLEKCQTKGFEKNAPNYVQELYAPFTQEEISAKITQIVKPKGMKADLEIVFQSVKNLHKACPNHEGDWYFTGNFPTPGGNRVVNKAFINYMKGVTMRAY
ncbi:amidophosphoribosyltransferase [Reichenbachiella agarivorans]|uniref:Amidophosphoribosyltransferase n=1 Tax=Reichenbachiella agarivorans TaxID=2979464 RepID=A0ABY6CJI3_9BACT|nr:amidophosphoribosyltransferase [Reichenbachiella agarivorans]UXP30686.1 amidophosphoribosyltransferase [Reichenbachiella agarivorans]